jgi:hypothetical protein
VPPRRWPARRPAARRRRRGQRPLAQQAGACPDGRPGVDGVVGDRHPPALDPARHAGHAVSGWRLSSAIRRKEGDVQRLREQAGDQRATLHRAAHGVDLVLAQPAGQRIDVRPQQGGPQEQRVEVEPQVPVESGAEIEVPAPRPGERGQLSVHGALLRAV